jgi:DNA-binding PadR family transcriptional regulator
MPGALTSTSHALLGLLAVQPWSTYELAKQVERSLGWFWPRAERKVYDEAKRLVESGHARSTDEATGARPRTVYHITPQGRSALEAWLGQPSAPPKLESEALVRVFFADAASLDVLRATIDDVARTAGAQLERLRALIEAAEDPEYPFAERLHVNALSLRFQLDQQRMMIEWASWASEQIAEWHDVGDPGDWDWRAALGAG